MSFFIEIAGSVYFFMSAGETRYEVIKEDAIQTCIEFIKTMESSAYLDIIAFDSEQKLMRNHSKLVNMQTSLLMFIHKQQCL